MTHRLPNLRSHFTLALCTILHGFTHAFGSMLVPLYLMMRTDLHLSGVRMASAVVSVYGIVYCLGSYAAGVLADRFNRKTLLGIGLLGNAAAIVAMGLTHSYLLILALAVAAGIFGTIFHPAANSLAPAHYPQSPGMAIGLLGIGTGLGFFVGPQYAGMRAEIHGWQRPCIEMGIAGIVVGFIFLLVAYDPQPHGMHRSGGRLTRSLRNRVIALAALLAFRDFAGTAMISLAAIYLPKVFGKNARDTGLYVGLMVLMSVIGNPLAVYLTHGRRRLPGLAVILVAAGLFGITTPLWPVAGAVLVMCIFQTLQCGSYAVSDAAMLERVEPAVRGRVVGIFLVIAGTFGSLGPWVMGAWVDLLGGSASRPAAYFGPFALLSVFIAFAAFSVKMMSRLGPALDGAPISPMQEISPQTIEPVM